MKPSQRNELMSNSFKFIFNKFYSFFKRIKLLSSKIKIVMNFKTSIQVTKTEIINNWKMLGRYEIFIEKENTKKCDDEKKIGINIINKANINVNINISMKS